MRLNPRARRMIVKVNPATGEVSVTAPTRRGLSARRWISRAAKQDWIARQLRQGAGPGGAGAGALVPFRGAAASKSAPPRAAPRRSGARTARSGCAGAGRTCAAPAAGFPQARGAQGLRGTARWNMPRGWASSPSRITVRDTASRWGSCSSARSLSFSWRLIFAPDFVLRLCGGA